MHYDWKSVQGFLSEAEGNKLAELADGKRVLEIGSWKGRSTLAIASSAESVVSIDHFRGDGWTGKANTLPEFLENIRNNDALGRVHVVVSPFQQALQWIDIDQFDMIFYDADHDLEPLRTALRVMERSTCATIAIHDYEDVGQWKESKAVIDEWLSRLMRPPQVTERLVYLE